MNNWKKLTAGLLAAVLLALPATACWYDAAGWMFTATADPGWMAGEYTDDDSGVTCSMRIQSVSPLDSVTQSYAITLPAAFWIGFAVSSGSSAITEAALYYFDETAESWFRIAGVGSPPTGDARPLFGSRPLTVAKLGSVAAGQTVYLGIYVKNQSGWESFDPDSVPWQQLGNPWIVRLTRSGSSRPDWFAARGVK